MDFAFTIDSLPPEKVERLLERGFRHFGNEFFIYQTFTYGEAVYSVIPLRIVIPDLQLNKKQKKCLRINEDLYCSITPTIITSEYVDLFDVHKKKFSFSAPESLFDLFSETPAVTPCKNLTLSVRQEGTLVAASFFDVLPGSISSVYAMYNLDHSKRSLGLFTLLKEIEYARIMQKKYLYHGYASVESSFYDYKKKFTGLEYLSWDDFLWKIFDSNFQFSTDAHENPT